MDKKYYIIGGVLVLLLILVGVLFFSSGSAPKPGNNTPVVLTWWKTFEDTDKVQDLITDYQTTHKNVTINFVKKDIANYEADLIDALAAGTGPDIFTIHNYWLPKHADTLVAMPENLMSVRTYKDTFVDVATADFIKDEKIYA